MEERAGLGGFSYVYVPNVACGMVCVCVVCMNVCMRCVCTVGDDTLFGMWDGKRTYIYLVMRMENHLLGIDVYLDYLIHYVRS